MSLQMWVSPKLTSLEAALFIVPVCLIPRLGPAVGPLELRLELTLDPAPEFVWEEGGVLPVRGVDPVSGGGGSA